MPSFQYRALRADGSIDSGNLDAGGRQEVYRLLEGRGLKPVGVEEAAGKSTVSGSEKTHFLPRSRRVSFRALEGFTRQLSSLLAAGVPLARSLQILGRETSSASAAEKWREVHDLVVDGASLADSMARSPETFPRVYTAMIQAGETGGFLDVVLGQIADFQLREKDLKAKVVSALIYPAVLLCLALAVLVFLLTFFIPRFQAIFAGFGAQLPLITRLIVNASDLARDYGPFLALIVVVLFVVIRNWLRSDQGMRSWQNLVLRLPVVGPLNARFAMTRFCRMLGTLIGAGVPLIDALRVARESIGNRTLVDAVERSIERVRQGDGLSVSLSDCPRLFPDSVLEMISVAEETGMLDKELVRLAATTDGDLDRQLKTAVSLAEPLLLFVMAGFIGTIFIGMLIPIFTIQEYIK
ncbi:type II secretion system F family protein [Candidatus Sumerlaeota bacterium]|nr:type II secretion system F family protein [Candidatus Sumerlaeota bacterium]